MLDLTFGEQVKIILSRKGMTIKELAENIEERTGKKMSRQNLTQRLGRDNFQEQDMRMIAKILGCSFHLSILEDDILTEKADDTYHLEKDEKKVSEKVEKNAVSNVAPERDITLGELVEMYEEEPVGVHEEMFYEEEPQETYEEEPREVDEEELQEFYIEEPQEAYEEEPQEVYEEEPQEVYEEELQERVIQEPEEAYEEESAEKELQEEISAVIGEATAEPEEDTENPEPAPKPEPEQEEEKKPRGWRAYFKRLKKPESPKEEEQIKEPVQEVTEPVVEESAAEDMFEENIYEETFEEDSYEAGEYEEDTYDGTSYAENVYEGAYEEEPAEEFYEPEAEEDLTRGERNPYTGREYESNSVRMHPTRIGYVQVYDRANHQWTDMTEWAFLGYQERKKALLGKDYEPPIYLD